jgi:lantibiotic modifying enzyme
MIQNASYETGLPGLSLFYFYYALYTGDEQYFLKAEDFFTRGIATLDLSDFKKIYGTDSLDGHLALIGRMIEFCRMNRLMDLDAEEYLLNIDSILSDLMRSKIDKGNFDLNCGAMAAGYYYLGRTTERAAVDRYLGTLVAGIEEKARTDADGGFYWELPPLANRIYLGLSHGSALLISFLSNVCERGVEIGRCDRIIRRAARYLLKQQHRYEIGLFPNFIGDPESRQKQFSLCYGDIGIGYALLRAGMVLEDAALRDAATEILQDCLGRKREDKMTLDASIIYGASGLAATWEKLYSISGDRRFDDAALYWYEQIPAYAVHANEFAGYKTRLVNIGAGNLWNTSFGWGIIGIGISLMRYVRRDLPPIDRLLSIA